MGLFDFTVLCMLLSGIFAIIVVIYDTANHTRPFIMTLFVKLSVAMFLLPFGVWLVESYVNSSNCKYVEEEKSTYEVMLKAKNVEYIDKYLHRKATCVYGSDSNPELVDAYVKSQTKNLLNDIENK